MKYRVVKERSGVYENEYIFIVQQKVLLFFWEDKYTYYTSYYGKRAEEEAIAKAKSLLENGPPKHEKRKVVWESHPKPNPMESSEYWPGRPGYKPQTCNDPSCRDGTYHPPH